MPPLRWIFFDVGHVMVSDDPSGCHLYRRLYDHLAAGGSGGSGETPEEFFARRTAHLAGGGHLWSFVALHDDRLGRGGWRARQAEWRAGLYADWDRHSPAIPGMAKALRGIAADAAAAGARLGIIANQPPRIEQVLRARGLWELFDIHAVSDTLGVQKPDPAIFRWALDRAGCDAGDAAMVGDRIDNDIRPAKALGMRTCWLTLDAAARGWTPADAFERAYAASAAAVNVSARGPAGPDETPDATAESPAALRAVLADMPLPGTPIS